MFLKEIYICDNENIFKASLCCPKFQSIFCISYTNVVTLPKFYKVKIRIINIYIVVPFILFLKCKTHYLHYEVIISVIYICVCVCVRALF
jgi:hypothetical protein